MNLHNFFNPKTIAVIGVSRNPSKIGHVLFSNIIEGKFQGQLFAVNPEMSEVLGKKCFASIKKIPEKIDLAIIAVPSAQVLSSVKECKEKGVRDLLIISAGFTEVGKIDLEKKLKEYLNKNKMNCIGVNCLGIYDAYSNLDALFIPRYRLKRPEKGKISFVCQSGAIGAAILDIATEKNHKFSKFISYGNATDIDESDLLKYLGEDENTKVICLYLEGVKNGDKFFKTAMQVSKKKPIIAIKGGLTEKGMKATLSHTGALAGNKEVFLGVFKQTGIIHAESLEQMFEIAALLEKGVQFQNNKICVITNGGGYGIISTDSISQSKNLQLSEFTKLTSSFLRKNLPNNVNIHNPLDLVGDATTERYKLALESTIKDKNVDAILLIVLYQTPLITTEVVQVISETHNETKKPIIVISTGSEFTENLSKSLEEKGLPVFTFPENAIRAIDKVIWYQNKIRK